MSTQETILKGKVTAYHIVYLPQKVDEREDGITITKARKLGAFVVIQVAGSKKYTVPSKAEKILRDSLDPTPDLCKRVTNTLIEMHPIDSEREFKECVTTRGKKAKPVKWYELIE